MEDFERFNRKIETACAPGGCWNWTGALTTDGYGSFRVNNAKTDKAHRVAYETHVGPISAWSPDRSSPS